MDINRLTGYIKRKTQERDLANKRAEQAMKIYSNIYHTNYTHSDDMKRQKLSDIDLMIKNSGPLVNDIVYDKLLKDSYLRKEIFNKIPDLNVIEKVEGELKNLRLKIIIRQMKEEEYNYLLNTPIEQIIDKILVNTLICSI